MCWLNYYSVSLQVCLDVCLVVCLDVWSAGCVLAELLLGQPIFPGDSGVDQLVEIIKVLGTPTRDQIREMNPNYQEFKFPQIKAHPWTKVTAACCLYSLTDCRSTVRRFNNPNSNTIPNPKHKPKSCPNLNFRLLNPQITIHYLFVQYAFE